MNEQNPAPAAAAPNISDVVTQLETVLQQAAPLAKAALEINNAIKDAPQSPFLALLHVRLAGALEALVNHNKFVAKTAETAQPAAN